MFAVLRLEFSDSRHHQVADLDDGRWGDPEVMGCMGKGEVSGFHLWPDLRHDYSVGNWVRWTARTESADQGEKARR